MYEIRKLIPSLNLIATADGVTISLLPVRRLPHPRRRPQVRRGEVGGGEEEGREGVFGAAAARRGGGGAGAAGGGAGAARRGNGGARAPWRRGRQAQEGLQGMYPTKF